MLKIAEKENWFVSTKEIHWSNVHKNIGWIKPIWLLMSILKSTSTLALQLAKLIGALPHFYLEVRYQTESI